MKPSGFLVAWQRLFARRMPPAVLNEVLPDEVARTCKHDLRCWSGMPIKEHGRFAHIELCVAQASEP